MGREVVEQGWHDDVRLALELESSLTAPVLTNGAYHAAVMP